MAEYTCCSSVAFERPNEDTFTFTLHLLPHVWSLGRLLKNQSARLLWHTFIDAEAVAIPTFLLAVRSFLQEHLRLSGPEVEALLNKDNTDALVSAVDRDGDGRVSACMLGLQLMLSAIPSSHPLTHPPSRSTSL